MNSVAQVIYCRRGGRLEDTKFDGVLKYRSYPGEMKLVIRAIAWGKCGCPGQPQQDS